jgi:hypothetical protein
LPQYDVGLRLLVPAAVAGLAVSATGWYVLNYIPVFRFFAAAFLGIAVGTVVSRVARRRVSPFLTGAAVASIVLGWVVAEAVWYGGSVSWISHGSGSSGVWIALPLLLACYLTYTRVR